MSTAAALQGGDPADFAQSPRISSMTLASFSLCFAATAPAPACEAANNSLSLTHTYRESPRRSRERAATARGATSLVNQGGEAAIEVVSHGFVSHAVVFVATFVRAPSLLASIPSQKRSSSALESFPSFLRICAGLGIARTAATRGVTSTVDGLRGSHTPTEATASLSGTREQTYGAPLPQK